MYFIGIDPGSIYTGLAILSPIPGENIDTFDFHKEYADPVELFIDLLDFNVFGHPCRIAIEDMLGSGRRDSNIVRTIKVVGYFEYRLQEYGRVYHPDLVIELVPQQVRLAYVSLVPKSITGKDETSAAAHALALRERNRNVLFDIEAIRLLSSASPGRSSTVASVLSSSRTQLHRQGAHRIVGA